jgi:predicted secreted protein
MFMKSTISGAITAHYSNAITELMMLADSYPELIRDASGEPQKERVLKNQLRHLQHIIQELESQDSQVRLFGLSNFPFCNNKKS